MMSEPLVLFVSAALFAVVLLVALILRRRRAARQGASTRSSEPVEALTGSRKIRRRGRTVAGLFFGMFLLAGLGFLIPFGKMAWGVVQSRTWEETTCTVLESGVESHPSSDGTTYSIRIRYRYRWDGQVHTSDRYAFTFGSSSGRKGKAEVVDRYPPGAEVTCWVDPGDAGQAVLYRGLGWEFLLVLLPLIFVVVGAAGVVGILAGVGAGPEKTTDWLPGTDVEEPPEARPATHAAEQASWMPAPSGTLEPESSPKGRLIGSFVGALFWNGIVGTMGYFMIRNGDADGCALAFLGLFGLIGIFLVALVPYYALALANPRPALRMNDELAPGRTVRLSWRFSGRVGRIRRLVLRLEGREEATYRRGTDTHTAKETFFEESLLETDQASRIPAGEVPVRVPEGTMHSFRGGNNEIAWSLHLEGEIPRWPDVTETFPVTVFPEELAP